MSSGYGDLTVQAHHLVANGDLAAAQELLADALADADPRPAYATPELTEAAGLHARVLVALGDPHAARGWAAFAYSATTRLHGPSDPRTVAAAATLAAVLHRVGSHARAARLYRDVIIELTASDGPESLRVLAAHADLATVEYARGECTVARSRLTDAWELHREVYGDGHLSGIKMLARLGAMQRDCGRFAEAHEHLALAEELCRQHLPADDPLAGQVSALARAAPNPDHVCADTAGESTGHTDQPGHLHYQGHLSHPGHLSHLDHPGRPDDPVVPSARTPTAQEIPFDPPGYAPPASRDPYRVPPSVPTPRLPPDPAGATAQPRFDDETDDDRWWPPEEPTSGAGAEHRSTTPLPPTSPLPSAVPLPPVPLPPAVPELTRQRAGVPGADPDDPDGVHRVRHLPVPRGNRLPVRVHQPRRQPSRKLPMVVAGVVVVLLGTVAVVAGVANVDDPAPPVTPQASTTPGIGTANPTRGAASPTPAAPGAPPTSVALRDNRDSITLTWAYPKGAEGPVVISGGRTGQQARAFQELPPGTGRYVVYGLDRSADYCFTVAVAYSVDTVSRAKPVCTGRQRR